MWPLISSIFLIVLGVYFLSLSLSHTRVLNLVKSLSSDIMFLISPFIGVVNYIDFPMLTYP